MQSVLMVQTRPRRVAVGSQVVNDWPCDIEPYRLQLLDGFVHRLGSEVLGIAGEWNTQLVKLRPCGMPPHYLPSQGDRIEARLDESATSPRRGADLNGIKVQVCIVHTQFPRVSFLACWSEPPMVYLEILLL